ncbi:MAG: hypothetical protein IPM30_14925 [Burkholderiales bacterium]|nr:hypothetical protein [Burkholderiales bacterium]
MLVINDPSSLSRVTDPEVRRLIEQRIEEYGEDAGLATFVVVEPGDPLGALDAQLGFSVLSNRFDGTRHGDRGFSPSFELAEDHGGLFELVFVLADYGDGVIVLVPKGDGIDGRLLSLCAEYAVPSQP